MAVADGFPRQWWQSCMHAVCSMRALCVPCLRGVGIVCVAMRQRILGSHTPPCHRHMVITTLSSMFCLAALQRKPDKCRMLPCIRHSRWLSKVLRLSASSMAARHASCAASARTMTSIVCVGGRGGGVRVQCMCGVCTVCDCSVHSKCVIYTLHGPHGHLCGRLYVARAGPKKNAVQTPYHTCTRLCMVGNMRVWCTPPPLELEVWVCPWT